MRPGHSDPYFIRGTNVLKNLLGITDAADLNEAECSISTLRTFELEKNPIKGAFDLLHLRRIHRELFRDIYDWAGEIRTTSLLKSEYEDGGRMSRFANPNEIKQRSSDIFSTFIQPVEFAKLGRNAALGYLASKWSEINSLHPFRDGNGRAIRCFFAQYMNEAGYSISFEPITKERWSRASIDAHFGNYTELERSLSDATDIIAIERVQSVFSSFEAMRRDGVFDWTEHYISVPPPNHTVSGKVAMVNDDVFAMVSGRRVEIGSVQCLGSVPKVGEYVEYTEPDIKRVFAKRTPFAREQAKVGSNEAELSPQVDVEVKGVERLKKEPLPPSHGGWKGGY
ncbi:MAG TPA: Fic family protein [Candidatus Baltobacteraceae bacterium]|jgi:cell filamentation protein|nr:Fic family protein [Candidatus Baltobacteraceae bacterium]